MPPRRRALPVSRALLLGLLQGPTELLPVSSSAHTSLVPLLAGWPYAELDPGLRKSFEVSLHAGAVAALAPRACRQMRAAELDGRTLGWVALACAPPAVAGFLLQGQIERRLGGPRATAGALATGGLAMLLADKRPARRALGEADFGDALAVGVGQAIALVPGVSRSGAALTAARARGLDRDAASALSWRAGLPLMLGASALSAVRTARRGVHPGARAMLAAGAGAAVGSTLISARILCREGAIGRPLAPCAGYRLALAALVARRLRAQ
jgi:undecaprenyl-diphosphatase